MSGRSFQQQRRLDLRGVALVTTQRGGAGIYKRHALPCPGEGHIVLRGGSDAGGISGAQVLRQRRIRKDEDPTIGASFGLAEVHRKQAFARLPSVMPKYRRGKLLHVGGHMLRCDEVDAIMARSLIIA